MPVVMQLQWDGVTPQQYDEACDVVGWESDAPPGGIFHAAWFEDGALRVLDVWETPDDFQAFVEARLTPGTNKVGLEGEPQVTIAPAHRIYNIATGEARS
jgi:hypothetical protein